MRLAVFVFSALLIFSTTYAHAIAFVPAVAGGLVRTAGGKVIKVASKKGVLATAGVAIGLYCKKNQKKCKDIIGDTIGDYLFDDDDDNQCSFGQKRRVRIQGLYYKDFETACNSVPYDKVFSNSSSYNSTGNRKIENRGFTDRRICQIGYFHESTKTEQFFGVEMVQSCFDEAKVTEQENEELAKKIAENLSDDDITYIINNYGDQLNIDKYCTTPNACIELDEQFGDEVMNNKHKYDIDRINKDNCEVKNNKIVSCDKAKKDTDDDDSDTPKDGDDGQDGQDGDDTKPKDKDKPIKCESSPFHKKVCDFIDWYYSDEYTQSDTKIDVQDDTPKPTNTNIDFSGSCPASYVVSHTLHFGMLGSYDLEFTLLDTPKLCGFLNDWIKPIMMFLGPLHAVYIIGKRDE